MDLFDREGHITDEAYRLLISGRLDELNRLEMAEHMSFCDRCVARYADLLTDDVLISPPVSMQRSILRKIRQRAGRLFLHKYVSMAVAASFALILWTSGVFTFDISPYDAKVLGGIANATSSFSQKTIQATNEISGGLHRMLNGFDLKGVFQYEKE